MYIYRERGITNLSDTIGVELGDIGSFRRLSLVVQATEEEGGEYSPPSSWYLEKSVFFSRHAFWSLAVR